MLMAGNQGRDVQVKLRWTIGSLMVVIAALAVAVALARPFLASGPPSPSGEVLGVDFDLQRTRSADGRTAFGFVPKIIVTRQATGVVPPSAR